MHILKRKKALYRFEIGKVLICGRYYLPFRALRSTAASISLKKSPAFLMNLTENENALHLRKLSFILSRMLSPYSLLKIALA